MGLFRWLFGSKKPRSPERPTPERRLQSPDSTVRREAAEELGASGGIDAVAPLVAATQDKDIAVQSAARNSLLAIAVKVLDNAFTSGRAKILAIEVLNKVGLMEFICQPGNTETLQRIRRALEKARHSAEFELEQARMGNLSVDTNPSANSAGVFQAADKVLKALNKVTGC